MTTPLRIAIAGLGTVGGDVVKALHLRGAELSQRAGRELEIVAVSARDRSKVRAGDISKITWTADAVDLAKSNADVVVELIGGEEGTARSVVEAALTAGKHVVTGNKALLARHGARLATMAEDKDCALKFEAAIAGGIPIVKALRESLISHGILAVRGILNGTCNYILTEYGSDGPGFRRCASRCSEAWLRRSRPNAGRGRRRHRAQAGAALEPRIRHKAGLDRMTVEGIERITSDDIRFAREFGFRIKLLGIARRVGDGIDQRVQPAMVRASTPLADVDGAFNAVVADAGAAGPYLL